MVYRVYVEKKKELANEARGLFNEIKNLLFIDGLKDLRLLNRYDVENIEKSLFDYAVKTVFSEPQLDMVSDTLPADGATVFAVEYLPGQFDQRADSAAQCIQLFSQGERPTVRTAKIYLLYGTMNEVEIAQIKKYVINPVECREASLELPKTLEMEVEIPESVATIDGFLDMDKDALAAMVKELGLAMDLDDITFCQNYFKTENRNPTITEIRMIDTYWSDHCRHTTFLTTIDSVKFEDTVLGPSYTIYYIPRLNLPITPIVIVNGNNLHKAVGIERLLVGLQEPNGDILCSYAVNTDTFTFDADNRWWRSNTWELTKSELQLTLVYSNDGGETWISTGAYVYFSALDS